MLSNFRVHNTIDSNIALREVTVHGHGKGDTVHKAQARTLNLTFETSDISRRGRWFRFIKCTRRVQPRSLVACSLFKGNVREWGCLQSYIILCICDFLWGDHISIVTFPVSCILDSVTKLLSCDIQFMFIFICTGCLHISIFERSGLEYKCVIYIYIYIYISYNVCVSAKCC
jgi:hypothetical protein